jgi:hypothetical protein
MIQNNNLNKKKELVSKPMKLMIVAASIAGTLGLGGIFSKADVQNTAAQATDAALPTVATLISVNPSSISVVNSAVADNSLNLLPVVTQAPITVVTSAPAVSVQAPAPITHTKSSR